MGREEGGLWLHVNGPFDGKTALWVRGRDGLTIEARPREALKVRREGVNLS